MKQFSDINSAMDSRSVTILVILLNGFQVIDARLIAIPRDTEVKINDSTYLNCSTSLQADLTQWRHGNLYVYTGIDFLEPYDDGRFSVEINASTGASNLVIRSVQPSDAGKYECLEDEGSGETRTSQLIVLDDDPVCKSNMHSDGVIGPNDCAFEPDEIKLSCSVTYHGNTLPILQWIANGDNQFLPDGKLNVTFSNYEVTSTLTMKSALELNNSSFVCQTTRSSEKNYSCSSDVIKILYVFSSELTINTTVNEEVSCLANTSQSCSYKWKWFSEEDSITVSNYQILKPERVGRHRCEANCSIQEKSCTVRSMYAQVHSETVSNAQIQMSLVALAIVAVLGVIVIVMIVLYRRNRNRKRKQNQVQEMKIRSPGGLPVRYHLDPLFADTISPKTVERENKQNRGLTILKERLFVVVLSNDVPTTDVYVYNKIDFRYKRRWKSPNLRGFRAQDIAPCNRNNCLYINGYISRDQPSKIFKFTLHGGIITEWSTGDNWGWGLSVTDQENVILAVFNKGVLKEYSPDGKPIREISMRISNPWHAIRLTNDHFVVTYGHNKNDDVNRVCVIDADGNFKNTYEETPGMAIGKMNRPVYLSIDEYGFVMVVDQGNSRVMLLNSLLTFQKDILTEKGSHMLRDPFRILLDESNDRLFVADNERNQQRVSIFNFRTDKRE